MYRLRCTLTYGRAHLYKAYQLCQMCQVRIISVCKLTYGEAASPIYELEAVFCRFGGAGFTDGMGVAYGLACLLPR